MSGTGQLFSRLSVIYHTYSIADKSEERKDHGSRVTLFSCKNFIVNFSVRDMDCLVGKGVKLTYVSMAVQQAAVCFICIICIQISVNKN